SRLLSFLESPPLALPLVSRTRSGFSRAIPGRRASATTDVCQRPISGGSPPCPYTTPSRLVCPTPPLGRVVSPEGDTWKWCTLTTSRGEFSGDRASRTRPSPGNFPSVTVFSGTTSRRESSFAPGSEGSGSPGVISPSCHRSPCVTLSKHHHL